MKLWLSPTERVIAWRLAEGRVVSKDEMIEALWSNREDGGPLCVRNAISVRMCRLRKVFFVFGIEIKVIYTFGYQVPAAQVAALRSVLADEIAQNYAMLSPEPRNERARPDQRTDRRNAI